MYAIGHVVYSRTASGLPFVSLKINGKWVQAVLENERDIPEIVIGDPYLFYIGNGDQFCRWVDLRKVAEL